MAGRWRKAGRLHPIHRGVHALGHPSVPIQGRLVAALLHAGRDAVLSHATAAWWWGLIADEPLTIDVSAPGYTSSTSGVRVHHPRHLDATDHRRFPITPVPRTLLDLAASTTLNRLRVALAQADYRRILDVAAVEKTLGQGRPGSAKLRRALERQQPRLALTRSGLDVRRLGDGEHHRARDVVGLERIRGRAGEERSIYHPRLDHRHTHAGAIQLQARRLAHRGPAHLVAE